MPDNANQQSFVVHKEPIVVPFIQMNKGLGKEVHKELKTGAAFSLGLGYSSNADGYSDDIYPTTIQKELGIGKQSYYNARDKLIDYGYLIVDKEKRYEYHFYEKSPISNKYKSKIKKSPTEEKELQAMYKDLIKKDIDIEDMDNEEWGLYTRGRKNQGETRWEF